MSSVLNDIPEELKDAWGRLIDGGDGRKLHRHLPALRQSLAHVKKTESFLNNSFGGIEPGGVDPAKRSEARSILVASLQFHALSVGGVLKKFSSLSADGQVAVKKVLGWIAEHLAGALTAFAKHLGIQNWSVAAGMSTTPPGASFTITLTFA